LEDNCWLKIKECHYFSFANLKRSQGYARLVKPKDEPIVRIEDSTGKKSPIRAEDGAKLQTLSDNTITIASPLLRNLYKLYG
jgi:hypothetical protein